MNAIQNLKAERDDLNKRVERLNAAIAILEGTRAIRKSAPRKAPAAVVVGVDLASEPDRTVAVLHTPAGGFRSVLEPVTPPGSVPLSRDRILRHLATHGRQTTAEIVEALCMDRGPVAGALSAMFKAGQIDRATIRNPDTRARASLHVYGWSVKA